jgi:hypothetical protein
MYSEEIVAFVENRNNRISIEEYVEIVGSSNQIKYTNFDVNEWKYKFVTNDGYEISFHLYE